MSDSPLTPEQERLLGRVLTHTATEEERRSLERARGHHQAVDDALNLLAEARLGVGSEALIDSELNMDHAEKYGPERLTELVRVSRSSMVKSMTLALIPMIPGWLFLLRPPDPETELLRMLMVVATALFFAIVGFLLWHTHRQRRRIAEGRMDWIKAAEELERFDGIMKSVWPPLLFLMAIPLLIGALLLIGISALGLLEFSQTRWWIVGTLGIGSGIIAGLFGLRKVSNRLGGSEHP